MTQDAKLGLADRTGFWLALGAVLAGLGGVSITIAVTEYHPPWKSVWFIVGAVACACGFISALWALVLYLARKVAEGRYQADRQRFMSDNFSVQQEALIKVKDLISNISEELWNLREDSPAEAMSGQLEPFVAVIEKIKKENRFASEADFNEFLKCGETEKEFMLTWLGKRSVFVDKIRTSVNELSVNTALSGSQSVAEAVDAYLKFMGRYMFSLPKDLKSIKDERIARENVFAAVGKALKEGPFAQ